MPKLKEIKFHSDNYDSIWLPSSIYDKMLAGLIQIDHQGIDWAGQEDEQESHCFIYINCTPEGDGTASEYYVISFHELDDDNGPYRLYTTFTLDRAIQIRNEVIELFPKAAVAFLAERERFLESKGRTSKNP